MERHFESDMAMLKLGMIADRTLMILAPWPTLGTWPGDAEFIFDQLELHLRSKTDASGAGGAAANIPEKNGLQEAEEPLQGVESEMQAALRALQLFRTERQLPEHEYECLRHYLETLSHNTLSKSTEVLSFREQPEWNSAT